MDKLRLTLFEKSFNEWDYGHINDWQQKKITLKDIPMAMVTSVAIMTHGGAGEANWPSGSAWRYQALVEGLKERSFDLL
ncbi:MAG: hypothetical protein PHV61_09220 [Limnochordia bacterium]|nr:hypothetical protein [Limnochordia bacterium]